MVVCILKCCVSQEGVAVFLDKQVALDHCKKMNNDFKDETVINSKGNHSHVDRMIPYKLTILPLIRRVGGIK